jgi:glycosidase
MKWLAPILLTSTLLSCPVVAGEKPWRDRLPEDEIIYFMLPDRFENGDTANDRGGLEGDRLRTGFDPAGKGFYNGGDLKGLTQRLDYIAGMGVTAIWLGPIFKNKPVQGGKGQESAGYHGYWVTDFTRVDPHLGTNDDMKAFVDAAHARGMKVYMDIITNHTADVIGYAECPTTACIYRDRAAFPYQRRGGVNGAPINDGFAGDNVQTTENFDRLTNPNYAYSVVVPPAEATVKVPAWLNDPIHYHNRGDTTFTNESSTMGDFVGLDDLMTESPRVVQGFIDIYGEWIDRYGIDGFRIDTAKHVNDEFWQVFAPAMIARAKAKGINNFHIFGEVATSEMDPALTAAATRAAALPSALDFSFAVAVFDAVARNAGTTSLERLHAYDVLYEGGAQSAIRLPTFLGNHDFGRFAWFARTSNAKAKPDEILARVKLAHAMLFFLRGVPVIYSGDEQGFVGDGNDQGARESLFASKVPSYLDNKLIGTTSTHAQANFNMQHPLYRLIGDLAKVRQQQPLLRRALSKVRKFDSKPGLFAVSRLDEVTGEEIVGVFNTSAQSVTGYVEVDARSVQFASLVGQCSEKAAAPGSLEVSLPAFGFSYCKASPQK